MQSGVKRARMRATADQGLWQRRVNRTDAPRPFWRARAAMAKPTRILHGQVAVEGGCLRAPALISTITESDVIFAKVGLNIKHWFHKYCDVRSGDGAPDGACESPFFMFLQKMRGAKMIAKMKEHVESNDGSWAEAQKNKILIFDQMPKIMGISVPEVTYGEEAIAGFEMRVLAVARSNVLLAVELLDSNLEYLRLGVLAHADADPIGADESPPKRSRFHCKFDMRMRIQGCPNALWNSQRNCWYIKYRDEDGFLHRKSFSPTQSDVDEKCEESRIATAHIAQAAYDRLAAGGAPEDGDPEDDEL